MMDEQVSHTTAPMLDATLVCDELRSGDVEAAIRGIWRAAGMYGKAFRRRHMTRSVADALIVEARRLKLLLAENTQIKHDPFLHFAHDLATVLEDDESPENTRVRDVQSQCAKYYRRSENFLPLERSARVASNGWGDFIYCRPETSNAFVATASGNVPSTLVHFDQWFQSPSKRSIDDLADRFAQELTEVLDDDSAVVLVKKEFGPAGPARLWKKIEDRLAIKPKIRGFDQSTGILQDGDTRPCVVLYDLAISGDGLHEIEQAILASTPDVEVQYVILYDYSLGKARQRLRGDIRAIFDPQKYVDLDPKTLAALPSAQFLPMTSESGHHFARIRLEHVDPLYFHQQRLRDGDWISRSMEVSQKYAGQWVAAHNQTVLCASKDLAEVQRQLATRWKSVEAAIQYVLPRWGNYSDVG